ncbi:1575_t:CDS:2, partial [Acaulospora morrowiae]
MIPLQCFSFAGNTENSVVDFTNLLENHDDCNVEIIVGEEPNVKAFKAHKFILTDRSTYFKNALSPQWASVENGIIKFKKPNISPSIFEVLFKYIYTGAISVGNNSLVDIAIASDELQLLEVYQYLEGCLLEDESVWNSRDVITILQYDSFVKLYSAAIKLACKNPEAIFNSEYFIRMKETYLINLLKCDYLELDEIEIWEYLIRWGIENTNSIL